MDFLTSVICGTTSLEGKRGDRYECRARDPTRRKASPGFPLKAFQNCTCTRWKGLFTSLIHAAFWPERMPRARKWKRATISGARGSAGRRRAVVGGAAEFPNGSFPRDPRQDVQGKPVDILRGKSGWAGEAAQYMPKSSDKKEVILTRGGAFPRDPRQDVYGKPVDILWGKIGLGRRSSPIYAEKQ